MYKAWYCRERQKGKSGNRCKNDGIREDALMEAISGQMGWVDAERFEIEAFQQQVDRIEVHAKNVVVRTVGE